MILNSSFDALSKWHDPDKSWSGIQTWYHFCQWNCPNSYQWRWNYYRWCIFAFATRIIVVFSTVNSRISKQICGPVEVKKKTLIFVLIKFIYSEKGTSINDVPCFLAFFDLPTYLCPIWSLLEKAAYLMTSFFVWPTLPNFFLRSNSNYWNFRVGQFFA